jgi:hypothetical protein
MVTRTEVVKEGKRWVAKVYWGKLTEVFGPYRFRWMAKVVAWLYDGMH